MFNNYQFPGTAFHAMQWPGVGITGGEADAISWSGLGCGIGIGIGI